jgi:Tat protein translocase TatB subunit
MFGSIGWMEIAIIAIIALLVVGPKGLPKLGRTVGKAMRDFTREANQLKAAIEVEADEADRRESTTKPKKKKKKPESAPAETPGADEPPTPTAAS